MIKQINSPLKDKFIKIISTINKFITTTNFLNFCDYEIL
jgi:hypothetical protein